MSKHTLHIMGVLVLVITVSTPVLLRGEENVILPADQWVRDYFNRHHVHPTLNDSYEFLNNIPVEQIKENTCAEYNIAVMSSQNPVQSLADIMKIITAKRQSIKDFIIKYKVDVTLFLDKDKWYGPKQWDREYAWKNNMFLFDHLYYENGQKQQSRRAFDGEKGIELRSNDLAPVQGGFSDLNNLEVFFDPWMPLVLSGLFDTTACDSPMEYYDLVLFFNGPELTLPDGTRFNPKPCLFEKKETINGSKCIVAGNANTTKYFDINKDYSLVQFESYHVKLTQSSDGNIRTGRTLQSKTVLSDLKNYGNGIWLPQKTTATYYDLHGNVKRQDSVTVQSVVINSGIPDSYFSDFLPDNTIVSDTTKDMVYKWSDRTIINGLTNEVVKSKRILFFRYISMLIGLVMMVTAVVLKYRRHRKQREGQL
ncbi:MAG: hypothetical protein Q4G68_01350 [Planctomycetia bacterium]|nr:hypothetical protein [Planctomycetia bacterium]